MKNERAAHLVFFCKKSFLFLNNFFCRIVGSDSYRPARPKQKSRVCAMERTRERRMHLIFPKGWKKVGPYGRSVNGWEDGASALFSPLLFFLLLQNRQLAGFYFPHSSSSRMQCARIHIPFCLVKPQQQTHKLVSNCTWRFVCEGGNETGKKTKPISHPDCKGMRNTSTREREREVFSTDSRATTCVGLLSSENFSDWAITGHARPGDSALAAFFLDACKRSLTIKAHTKRHAEHKERKQKKTFFLLSVGNGHEAICRLWLELLSITRRRAQRSELKALIMGAQHSIEKPLRYASP